jgi:hypothetical protein
MPGADEDSWSVDKDRSRTLANERRVRASRATVWLIGMALGAAGLLTLTLQTWGSEFPIWVGMILIAATMLCGDMAERVWRFFSKVGPQLT